MAGDIIASPTGRVHFRGLRVNDELHGGGKFGLLNISEAWRQIPEGEAGELLPIDAGLLANVRGLEVNKRYARQLDAARLQVPILMTFAGDGIHVIDGAHRIARLHQQGRKSTRAHLLSPDALGAIRVRQYREIAGAWQPDDIIEESAFARLIEGARAYLKSAQAAAGR